MKKTPPPPPPTRLVCSSLTPTCPIMQPLWLVDNSVAFNNFLILNVQRFYYLPFKIRFSAILIVLYHCQFHENPVLWLTLISSCGSISSHASWQRNTVCVCARMCSGARTPSHFCTCVYARVFLPVCACRFTPGQFLINWHSMLKHGHVCPVTQTLPVCYHGYRHRAGLVASLQGLLSLVLTIRFVPQWL